MQTDHKRKRLLNDRVAHRNGSHADDHGPGHHAARQRFRLPVARKHKSDAIADVQRALNIMTREISNSGLKLPGDVPTVSSNGIVAGDSGEDSIRVVSNLNGMPDPRTAIRRFRPCRYR